MRDTLWRIGERFSAHRALLATSVALLIGCIVYVDHATGVEIGISLFYVLPIYIVSIYFGTAAGCALGLGSGVVWFVLNALPMMWRALHPGVYVWNSLMRTGFFLLTVAGSRVYLHMREAQKITELKSKMLSLVSHDLGNITAVIKLATLILQESDSTPPPDRAMVYSALSGNIDTMAETVQTFLDMARLESGRFEVRPQRVLLRSFTEKIIDGYSFALKNKALMLELDMRDHSIPVFADPAVLNMVLGNLLGNAIKYTPNGGRVLIRLRKINDERGEISIEDTGVGIPLEDQEKIFSGFYRTNIGTNVAQGTGLGLKLTREMVELCGGELKLESTIGRGSRFYFSLPLWQDSPPKL